MSGTVSTLLVAATTCINGPKWKEMEDTGRKAGKTAGKLVFRGSFPARMIALTVIIRFLEASAWAATRQISSVVGTNRHELHKKQQKWVKS